MRLHPIPPSWRLLSIFLLAFFPFYACKTKKQVLDDNLPVMEMEAVVTHDKPSYKGSARKDFLVRHTKLELTPDWKTRSLKGKAVLTIQTGAYPQDTLILDARGMTIDDTPYFPDELPRPKPNYTRKYRYDGRKLYIAFPFVVSSRPGNEFQVHIEYTAYPEDQFKKGLIEKTNDQGLYFVNPDGTDTIIPRQLWTQGEVKNSSAWYPTIDEPNQKMTQEIYLTVDTGLVTLSNGELVYSNLNGNGTRTDYWQMEKPHAPYLTMIAAGDWEVTEDEWRDSIPVQYYLEKRYAPYAKTIFGPTPEMMEFFSKRVGVDFPWPKYSQVVVREFVTGAMENTSAVTFYDPVQHDNRQHLDNTQEDIIAHELFHHWFGDLVTCESWAQVALNESFATLGESLWLEYKYGKDEASLHLRDNLAAYLGETVYTVDAIINHYYRSADNLFDAHRYHKGALVLNMLRDYLGDEVFFASVKNYLIKHAYQTVEFSDLRKAFEETSGEDLQWFFMQWFEKPGHPVLEILHEYQATDNRYRLVVNQQQSFPDAFAYKVPVEVQIVDISGAKRSERIWLKNWNDTFYFQSPTEPLLVDFDPMKNLLCQKTEHRAPKQWYAQYLYGTGMGRVEALEFFNESKGGIGDSLYALIGKGRADSTWYVRKKTIENLFKNEGKITGKHAEYARDMAIHDKNSSVRAAAISFLSTIEVSQGSYAYDNKKTYIQSLKDSSYMVVASAIRALKDHISDKDSLELLLLLLPLESIHGTEPLLAIGDVYARYGVPGKSAFFRTGYPWILPQSLSRFIDAYRQYLLTQPLSVVYAEKEFVLGVADHAKDFWSMVVYRNMLLGFVKLLETPRNDESLGQQERNELSKAFRDKAETFSIEK